MEWQKKSQARDHCSKICYGKTSRKDDDGPDMPPLDKESITEDAYVCLVKEIVRQAADDVTQLSPESSCRKDAEKFFLSPFFEAITGFDGKTILDKLHKEPRRRRYVRRDISDEFE